MSEISRAQDNSTPISSYELDFSGDESFSPSHDSWNSPTTFTKSPKPMPVKEFRKSLETEKSIRKLMFKLESLDGSPNTQNGQILGVLEKNYKLQIQTLLEEVNKLKLEKKIFEKKLEKAEKDPNYKFLQRRSTISESGFNEADWKQTLEAKNSTIRELEFQVSQFKNENNALKARLEGQSKQISELFQRLAVSEDFKDLLEEKEQEIAYLKENLETEERKHDKILQELAYLKSENVAMKLKSHNNSFAQMPTGTTSLYNVASKDQSFFSTVEKNGHYRASSDTKCLLGAVLNFSELGGEEQRGSSPIISSPNNARYRGLMLSSRSHREVNSERGNVSAAARSELNQLQKLSVKVLSDYEKGLKRDKTVESKKDSSKTLDRIIEVNKIKSFYIEAQNKKLMSILNAGKSDIPPVSS